MGDIGINQIKLCIQWNIIGVLNSMGVIKVSEPQTVWNRACWSYFLGRISHSRSVCAAATRELALNLILKETNILFSQSLCTIQPNRGVRNLDGNQCKNVIFRWRVHKSKNTSSVNAPTTVIKQPWQYFCTYLYKETPAGWPFLISSHSVESNLFYISIHGNDIDLGSATQWAHTVPGPRNGAIFRPR